MGWIQTVLIFLLAAAVNLRAATMSETLLSIYPNESTACGTLNTSLTATNRLLEGFQITTTGYEHIYSAIGYTEVGTTANITPAADSTSLTSGKPTGACNQAWKLVVPTDGTHTYAQWDNSTEIDIDASGFTATFYLYIEVAPDATENYSVFRLSNSTDSGVVSVTLNNTAGVVQVRAVGSTASNLINTATGAWHKIVVFLSTVTSSCTIAVNDGTAETFTRTSNRDVQIMRFGSPLSLGAGDSGTIWFDLIALGTP